MATWQFKLALVPQAWIDAGGSVDTLFGDEGYDCAAAWANHGNGRLEAALGSILEEAKSWHPNLKLWGKIESDDIQLWRENGKVETVQVRLDLRNLKTSLFREIVRVAQELNLAIVSLDTKRQLHSDVHVLLRAAAESDAAHFCLDPSSFLMQIDGANDRAT